MFTTGRIIFAVIFIIAFIIFMVISYKKDAKNHEAYYKNAAKKVAIYLANDGELDAMPFIKWCWQQQKQVYVPVLHPFCAGHLLFLLFERHTVMVKNHYGINEPVLSVNNVCPLNQLDVLCTPLVAFDQSGARLGMGGGFYDRTLSNWQQYPLYPIGLAHDCQQVEHLPTESWDIPLPKIVTPSKTWQWEIHR